MAAEDTIVQVLAAVSPISQLGIGMSRSLIAIAMLMLVIGCRRTVQRPADSVVTLYTSVDEPYVRPLIDAYEASYHVKVTLLTDAEASKSVGLAERLQAEKDHPQADVWWDNELFLTLRLAQADVLEPYDSPAAADLPAAVKDVNHRWAAAAVRARVIVVSPKYNGAAIRGIEDLTRPEFRGKIALARPTAGTTGGHVAALFAVWPTERATGFFRKLADNQVALLGGNALVAESVARDNFSVGICDNDDAFAASEIGPIRTVIPDQQADGIGTLEIPCALSLIADAPHANAGRALIDYLLSAKVADQLVANHFAFASARRTSATHWMSLDVERAAKMFPDAVRTATSILEHR